MKIAVLGATGQIGFALTQRLAAAPHQVTILIRDARNLSFPANVRVTVYDAFSSACRQRVLRDADHVIYSIGIPAQFPIEEGLKKYRHWRRDDRERQAVIHS